MILMTKTINGNLKCGFFLSSLERVKGDMSTLIHQMELTYVS